VNATPSSAGWGAWASWALRAIGAICVLRVLVLFASGLAGASIQVGAARSELEQYSSYELAYLSGSCLYVLAFLVVVPLFLVWIYRARSRQRWFSAATVSGATEEVSPIRAVLVWFIPALNLFLPYTTIEELFRDEGERPSDPPLYLPVWWGTFIASGVIGVFVTVSRIGGAGEIAGFGLWIRALQETLLAVSAFLAARFVAEFERRTKLRSLESVF
jgi:hypothetical protein